MKSIKNFSILPRLPKGLKKKVYVGMSGGVDSSVSALMLMQAGYDVTGVFIKTWSPEWMECNWRDERRDAIRVAAHIDIPLITLDLEQEYKKEVVDYLISEYKIGRTPNPDVMCNKYIKFGAFYNWARTCGADYVATGHYARIQDSNLLTGKDKNKDQSYFLWTLSSEILEHTIFPVGHLKKDIVRKIAKDDLLPVADKKDSQGVCFLGAIDMKEFLSHYIDTKPGDVLNSRGEKIGTHKGALLYTIGEHYIGYIVERDLVKNTLTITDEKPENVISQNEFELKDVNWISGSYPNPARKYTALVRYRQNPQEVRMIEFGPGRLKLQFAEPQVVAPGQSVVIYNDDVCIGGGVVA